MQPFTKPVIQTAANSKTLPIGNNHETMAHLDVSDFRVWEVEIAHEGNAPITNKGGEALRALVQLATHIVMRAKHAPCGSINWMDANLHVWPSLKAPPVELVCVRLINPVWLQPVHDVKVTTHSHESPFPASYRFLDRMRSHLGHLAVYHACKLINHCKVGVFSERTSNRCPELLSRRENRVGPKPGGNTAKSYRIKKTRYILDAELSGKTIKETCILGPVKAGCHQLSP